MSNLGSQRCHTVISTRHKLVFRVDDGNVTVILLGLHIVQQIIRVDDHVVAGGMYIRIVALVSVRVALEDRNHSDRAHVGLEGGHAALVEVGVEGERGSGRKEEEVLTGFMIADSNTPSQKMQNQD